MKDYSQYGEQALLIELFSKIGETNRVCVEFGGADGHRQSNTRHFANQGWDAHYWDTDPKRDFVKKHHITAENINDIFTLYNLPPSPDLVSIDIDGNDFWVFRALKFTPRVVIIEYNPSIAENVSKTIKYDPDFRFDRTLYHGASFSALMHLAKMKGYHYYANTALNLIFTKEHHPTTHIPQYTVRNGWGPDKKNRQWIEL